MKTSEHGFRVYITAEPDSYILVDTYKIGPAGVLEVAYGDGAGTRIYAPTAWHRIEPDEGEF